MKATHDSSLDGFEQRLLGELRRFVELRAAEQAPIQDRLTARRPQAGRLAVTPGRWMTAGATAAVIGCIMALIGFSSDSAPSLAQAFPILAKPAISTPETLQRFLNRGDTQLSDALSYARARAFTTPWGTGYVLLDQHANLICLAAAAASISPTTRASAPSTCPSSPRAPPRPPKSKAQRPGGCLYPTASSRSSCTTRPTSRPTSTHAPTPRCSRPPARRRPTPPRPARPGPPLRAAPQVEVRSHAVARAAAQEVLQAQVVESAAAHSKSQESTDQRKSVGVLVGGSAGTRRGMSPT
jgi:hypothetical protein